MAPTTSRPARTRVRPSLVVTPAVVAHRGASGRRPEHTPAAVREAVRDGVDDVELDVVPTRDGVLVVRHDAELSATTDVASRSELADRRTTKDVDGRSVTGWFAEDLTLEEVRRLRARERHPAARPGSAAHDGREAVATLSELLAVVRAESERRGRSVGVMVEVKGAARAAALGLPVEEPLLADLRRHGLDHPRSRVTLMSFETTVLRRLARATTVPLVQLLDRPDRRPADLAAVGDPTTYADLATPEGLALVDDYADGVGAHKDLVLPRRPDGTLGVPTDLVREAHRRWLTVHVWTLRAENRHLPADLRSEGGPDAHGDLRAEARAFLDAGVDGLICDHPEVALAARAEAAAVR